MARTGITADEFLKTAGEDEIFSVIERFLNRLKENELYKDLVITDELKGLMIKNMKEEVIRDES